MKNQKKRYPFSKKALQAMFAATIAFSPVAAGVGVLTQPTQVAAAEYNSVDDLLNRLEAVYQSEELTSDDRAVLVGLYDKFNNISESDWEDILGNFIVDGYDVDKAQLAADIVTLLNATTQEALKENLNDFRSEYSDAEIKEILGDNDLTREDVLNYIAEVELNFLSNLSGNSLEDLSVLGYYSALYNAIDEAKGEYPKVHTALTNTFSLNISGLLDLKSKLDEKEITITKAEREVLLKLANEVMDQFEEDHGDDDDRSSGGGGGGGSSSSDIAEDEVNVPSYAFTFVTEGDWVITRILPERVEDIISQITSKKIVIPVELEKVSDKKVAAGLPANLFTETLKVNKNVVVSVQTEKANYDLPISEIDIPELAKKLDVEANDIEIRVAVNVVKTDSNTDLEFVSDVIEFTVEARAGEKSELIGAFSTYVEREITADKELDASKAVAVKLNKDGSFSSVPTLIDGEIATIKSLTNSEYAVVENEATFPDVTNKNWGKEYIETLASKYIIEGYETGKYIPSGDMTRAEFTVLLVRALGLPGVEYDQTFDDVKGTEWFNKNGELMAAIEHGIIEGMGDGNFAPNEKITRAQAAVMIKRTMDLDFINYDKSQLNTSKNVADFKDQKDIPQWAVNGVKEVYQAGIVSGHGNGTFEPNGHTTREQMAKILAEFLISADLMDDTIED